MVQSKEWVIERNAPCIVARGRKGGSNVAAAICNALLYRAHRAHAVIKEGFSMEYRRFKDTLVIRMDKGEEIVEQLTAVAAREHIALAEVSALGAVGSFTAGVFYPGEKEYHSNDFTGDFESSL